MGIYAEVDGRCGPRPKLTRKQKAQILNEFELKTSEVRTKLTLVTVNMKPKFFHLPVDENGQVKVSLAWIRETWDIPNGFPIIWNFGNPYPNRNK
ncbi:MAG: hypothetical protein ACXABY_16450 [Candidatus Thorarchaeota archaeon]|jgi:hypothetical protein